MRNAFKWLSIGCIAALWGCEEGSSDRVSIELRAAPLVADAGAAPTISQAVRYSALDDRRALFAHGENGLQLLDLRDPAQPKLEPVFNYRSLSADGFYHVGERVLLVAYNMLAYTGARDDLPLPRNKDALYNLDIHDPAHPTVVDELVSAGIRNTFLRRDGEAAALLGLRDAGGQDHLVRYELRDGRLVQTAEIALGGFVRTTSASADWLALSVGQRWEPRSHLLAIDLRSEVLEVSFRTSLDAAVLEMTIDSARLQVAHCTPNQDGSPFPGAPVRLDTFDLQTASSSPISNGCDLGTWPGSQQFRDPLLTLPGSTGVAFDPGAGLERITLSPSGTCQQRGLLAPHGSRHALLAPAPDRLLALGPYQLNLYDMGPDADGAPLGTVVLYTPFAASDLTQPIQRIPLATPSAAQDGTPEPWLVSVAYHGPHPIGRFQLATMSDRTLTARGRIDDPDPPRLIGRVGQSLFTVSASRLRTFDVAALDAPALVGEQIFQSNFEPSYRFGEYIAGFRSLTWWNAWNVDPADRPADDLEIRSPDGKTTIATLPVNRWFVSDAQVTALERVGDLLVRFEYQIRDWDNKQADVHFIVYDLRDPQRPRHGAHLTTGDIRGTFFGSSRWPQVSYTYDVVGDAFVFTELENPLGFRALDLHDPTRPVLHTRLTLPGTNLTPHSKFRSGNKLYAIQTVDQTVYGTAVDFSNPAAPVVGTRRVVPGYLVGATEDALYSYALRPGTTLSKISWDSESSSVLATNTLPPGRMPRQILDDQQGHLFVLHERDPYAPLVDTPRAGWIGLDIFNSQTLEKLGSLEIDSTTDAMRFVDGALLIPVSGAILRIDMSDERNPRVVPASQK